MLNSVVFETTGGNEYLHSPHLNQILLIHPALAFLLELRRRGGDPRQWLTQLEGDGYTGEDGTFFPRTELEYYLGKYDLLAEAGYLQPADSARRLGGRLKSTDIPYQLANCDQLTFEVTEACNLDCHYCGYGKFYNRSGARARKKMEWRTVQTFLNYMLNHWNSNLNQSHHKNINISFYGGEPLMNFNLIRQTAEYALSLPLLHNQFNFSMTTNGALLDKHMDFLARHDFWIHISQDGDEFHNSYRTFSGGAPVFPKLRENIALLKNRYPDYFREKVHFIAVLHNRNSMNEVMRYFRETYDKRVLILELNTNRIAPEHEEEFRQTYRNRRESLEQSGHDCGFREDFFRELPEVREANAFLAAYGGHARRHLHQLIHLENHLQHLPTATCPPFGNKIYITAHGQIMPCERIDPCYSLGEVRGDRVALDFQAVAQQYNQYYDQLNHMCNRCYMAADCGHCLFYLPNNDNKFKCPGCTDSRRFTGFLSQRMSVVEKNPAIYHRFMEDVNIT